MKVLELKGFKSLRALNVFHTLMLGLKMLPMYMGDSYEDFYARIDAMPPCDQEKMIREAALFVELQKEEVEALMSFCADANGVPYSAANMKNLGPKELHEAIVSVCMRVAAIKIDLVSDSEKKKLRRFSVDVRSVFIKHPYMSLEDALNVSFYEACHV